MSDQKKKVLKLKIGAKTVKLDGDHDILITSKKHISSLKPTFTIDDESLDGMILRIKFRLGTMFMIAENTNFIETYKTPSAYYRMWPQEKFSI